MYVCCTISLLQIDLHHPHPSPPFLQSYRRPVVPAVHELQHVVVRVLHPDLHARATVAPQAT